MPKNRLTSMGAYNIVLNEPDNSATVDMYGEVVDTRPVDMWTGQPVAGNYIMLDEFLADLEKLKTKDSVTVHINSVGGSFYAGLAIYNRLKTLGASITTINDSLAASAGSIIFMAGDKGKRKVYAGSNLMVHGVMGFLYGYYNISDLQDVVKTLKAHDKAAIAAYVEATGLDTETVKAAMSKDTYMTGQEAVDAGWADEVITDDNSKPIALSPDKSLLMVGGHAVAACLFGKLPEGIPQMSAEEWAKYTPPAAEMPPQNSMEPAPQAAINTNPLEVETMEIRNTEELRNAFPEFVAQIETAARSEAVAAERQRLQGIEDIQNVIGDAALIASAKFGEKPMNAQELAYAAMKAQSAMGTGVLAAMQRDAQPAAAVAADPAPAAEPTAQTEDEQAAALLIGAIPANLKKEGK